MNVVAAYTPTAMSNAVVPSLSQTNNNTVVKTTDKLEAEVIQSTEVAASPPSPSSNQDVDETMGKREPDADAIKMFVGQIPKTMEESELREMFAKFGDIHQLNVLRDKATGQHRGCCFVTFYTRKAAIMAQDELHGRQTLPGMHHPIQMKPADNEKKNVEDRKLFIGMVSKKLAENDIRALFSAYGNIEDCMILRDTAGVSRGCAFVTYAVRQSALNAIQQMHHSQTMEGCSSPLVVKFADTQKDKDVRTKMLTGNNNILAGTAYSAAAGGIPTPPYLAFLQQSLATTPMNGSPLGMSAGPLTNIDLASLQNYHNIQNLQNMGMLAGQSLIGLPALSGAPLTMARTVASPTGATHSINTGLNTIAGASQKLTEPAGLQAAPGQPQAAATAAATAAAAPPTSLAAANPAVAAAATAAMFNGGAGVTNPVSNIASYPAGGGAHIALPTAQAHSVNPAAIDATLSQAYNGIAQYTASFPNAYASVTSQTALSADSPAGKQTEGPDGANLFIYHLPQEFTDMDLLQAFAPFGNVVSSKVFIDKQTNLSKCFGFVSFDNPMAAQTAIAAMNGFQVGMKRLKVQLKRPKNENKPYCFSPLFYKTPCIESFKNASNQTVNMAGTMRSR